jgi:glycosyltransferase involved in cell wall biosynthesis
MNILILNQYALPQGAAGITRHGDLGAELGKRGHHVTVIASAFDYFTREGRQRPGTSDHGGVKFVWLSTGEYVGNDRRRVASMIRFCLKATWYAALVRPRPDVIIGSSPNLLAALSARTAAWLLRRPWIFEIRDFWPSALVDLGAIRKGSRTHRVLGWLERRLYASANGIVTVPPHGFRRFEELGIVPVAITHIPNSTDLGSPVGDLPSSLKQELAALGARFLVVYAGQLGVTHDLLTVLRGLAHLRQEDPQASERLGVMFVGDGVERERTVALAEELGLPNVRFHPAIEKSAIPALLDHADACLMAAGNSDYFKYGLSPNKLFDYFAAAKPVLMAAAAPSVVDEGGAGLRYQPGDPAAVARAIRQLMEASLEERAAMGERGRELVRTRYSVSAVADQYEELLQRVVAQHRG